MMNKSLVILVLAGMVTTMLSTMEEEHTSVTARAGGSHGTFESTSLKLFLRDRPLPDSCINDYHDDVVPPVAHV